MKLLSVLVGALVGFVFIAAFVAWIVVRLTTPAPGSIALQAVTPAQLSVPTVPCGDGTYGASQQICTQARQYDTRDSQSQALTADPSPFSSAPEPIAPVPPPDTAPVLPLAPPVSLHDGHYHAGSETIVLANGQAIVGQSYEVNGQGGGCHVFGGNGPTSVTVIDGEWWVFDATLSDPDLQRLMGVAELNQQRDPQAQCAAGSLRMQV